MALVPEEGRQEAVQKAVIIDDEEVHDRLGCLRI
jgi:hypothetical protein